MLYQYSIGIDVQPDQVRMVVLKSGLKRHELAAHTAFGFDDNHTQADKIKIAAELADDIIKRHHLGAPAIYLSIPREATIVRHVRMPLAVKENLRTTLGYELHKYIPMAADEVYYDTVTISEDSETNELRILLFAVRKSDLDIYLTLSAHLNQNLSGIEIKATAMSTVLASRVEKNKDSCAGLIDQNSRGAEISLYRDGVLASNQMIRTSSSDHPPASELATAIATVVSKTDIGRDKIHWYAVGENNGKLPLDALKDQADITLSKLPVEDVALPSGDFLTSYALALRGVRRKADGMNLLPKDLRKKPDRTAYYIMWGLVLLTLILTVAWVGSRIARHQMAVAGIESQLTALQGEARKIETLNMKKSDLDAQYQGIRRLMQNRSSSLTILQELTRRIPQSAWVNDFSLSRSGVQISGLADSAGDLLPLLEDSPVFQDVVFLTAITRANDGKERFRIGMKLQ